MGKQHETIPNEPQEAPVRSPNPEVQQPEDPSRPEVPQEVPGNEPVEMPPRAATKPGSQSDNRVRH